MSPMRAGHVGDGRAEPAASIASSRVSTHARVSSVSRQLASTSGRRAGRGIHVTGPRLATHLGYTIENCWDTVDIDGLIGVDADHAVVGDDGEQGAGRQAGDHRFHQASTWRSCIRQAVDPGP